MRRFGLASALLAAGLAGCAPSGFVETTANVIDEMTAFRDARKKNTREGWESFIRQYPDSGKAAQAKQWIQMMPEARADEALVKRELAKAEAERAERLRLQEDLKRHEDERLAQAARHQEEERRKQEEEAKRLAAEKLAQAAAQAQTQVAASTAAVAMLADLQRRMDDLEKRERALKAREDELAKAAAAAAVAAAAPSLADDIDLVPKGGLPQSDENFAVVIGVEKYRDIAAGADYAERDARTAMLYLRDYLGVPEQNIKLLTGERASRSDFAKILELWLPLQVTPESKVYIYYSGHGAPDPNSQQAYLLPYDGDPKALELTAYPLKRLYEKLGALSAKQVIVALDSCFSGAGGRSVIAQGARPLMAKVEEGKLDPSKNITVFAAASSDEITGSYEPQKHGLFTYYFLRGLRGDADADSDGWVSVDEEYAYLKKNVSRQANRDSRQQTPQLQPDLALRKDKGALRLSKTAK
ncbi:MAG: hypothetical protein A2V88_05095 [Elusimicrobia bacterium RBG_16_66_12]|nr:MAG: hypothetical protein A2V88_05095 [Elusimicrobia bacterium RBG_16_66_12]